MLLTAALPLLFHTSTSVTSLPRQAAVFYHRFGCLIYRRYLGCPQPWPRLCNCASYCWLQLGQDFATVSFPAGDDHCGLPWRKLCHRLSPFPMKECSLRLLISKNAAIYFQDMKGQGFLLFPPALSCCECYGQHMESAQFTSDPFDHVHPSVCFPAAVTSSGIKYNCSCLALSPQQAQTPSS